MEIAEKAEPIVTGPLQNESISRGVTVAVSLYVLLELHETMVFELHDFPAFKKAPDTYGMVTLETAGKNKVLSEIVRSKRGEFEFPTRVE